MKATNIQMERLIQQLNQQAGKVWKRIAADLQKSSRMRRIINVYKIDKVAKEGETVLVPGKVLGTGSLTHNVRVAAFMFSKQAAKKINQKGQAITIQDLLKENPSGKNVRILG